MIIAFSAKAQSGKTTAARAIRDSHIGYTILSFATPLKRMAMEQFGLTQADIEDKTRTIVLGGRETTVRQLLIDIGQMYRRLDPDFWVKKLWKDAEAHIAHGNSILIDDLRFKNEANFLARHGTVFVRVERPGVSLIDDISEKDLDDYPFTHRILNDNGLEGYMRVVLEWAERLKAEAPLP
jgi:hypothetical protein